jgi:hypothetical protein
MGAAILAETGGFRGVFVDNALPAPTDRPKCKLRH